MPTYPLTGSAEAELEARLANFRLAQSRLGFMNPTLRLTIGGTDRYTQIEKYSISITQRLDAPWTATMLTTWDSFTPVEGQEIVIGIGELTNRLFGGHITEVRQIHDERGLRVRHSISCLDYTWLFDRRRVLRVFGSDNIESMAHTLLSEFATGFTGEHIEQSLGFLTGGRSFTMETMSACFKRLAQDGGAYFYIDPYKDVHLVATDRVPQPHDLSSSYTDFENVVYSVDLSQIKTRVYVEGAGAALTERYGLTTYVTVDDTSNFPSGTFDIRLGNYAPTGTRRLRYAIYPILSDTTLEVQNSTPDLTYGDLLADLNAFPIGTPVNLWVIREDTAAQTALAALEGGDGIHEDYIQDRRLSYDGCVDRGDAELARYADPIERLTYRTRDPNTRPGGRVTVNLPTQGITGTFTIQSVTISAIEEATNKHPWRQVTASASEKSLWDIYQAALTAAQRNTI